MWRRLGQFFAPYISLLATLYLPIPTLYLPIRTLSLPIRTLYLPIRTLYPPSIGAGMHVYRKED